MKTLVNQPSMLLNISIFRNTQVIFAKFFLLFIAANIAEEAEFCFFLPVISTSPNFLVLRTHIETTTHLVEFLGVPLCHVEMFTCLQKRNERAKWSAETTEFILLPKDHFGVRNISGYPSLALRSHLKHLIPDQQRKFQ